MLRLWETCHDNNRVCRSKVYAHTSSSGRKQEGEQWRISRVELIYTLLLLQCANLTI